MVRTSRWRRCCNWLRVLASLIGVGCVFLLVFGFWVWLGHRPISLYPGDGQSFGKAGTYGDSFGYVNSLFSALAFAGVIIALVFQMRELHLQRQELKETREIHKQSALLNSITYDLEHWQKFDVHDPIESLQHTLAKVRARHVNSQILTALLRDDGDVESILRDVGVTMRHLEVLAENTSKMYWISSRLVQITGTKLEVHYDKGQQDATELAEAYRVEVVGHLGSLKGHVEAIMQEPKAKQAAQSLCDLIELARRELLVEHYQEFRGTVAKIQSHADQILSGTEHFVRSSQFAARREGSPIKETS